VVIIDADLRKGHIHLSLGMERAPGLSDVLADNLPLEQVLRETPVPNMKLLTTGTIPPNPSELLLRNEFAELLEKLSKQYDMVIVDTPPVLAVTDAAVVGRLAGTTMLVLKSGEHSMRMIQDCHRRLQGAGVNVRGTLFNQVSKISARYGYNYGYYKYEYTRQGN